MKDLLQYLNIGQRYEFRSGDRFQDSQARSFEWMLLARGIHRNIGIDKMDQVTQVGHLPSTHVPSAPNPIRAAEARPSIVRLPIDLAPPDAGTSFRSLCVSASRVTRLPTARSPASG